jgi:hypothetical protein
MTSCPSNDEHQQQMVEGDRAFIPREAVVRLFESIQESNQDIVIHSNTGTFTAEAREPDRMRRMFLQLQHARRLCNTFERAAESTSDAHSLLEEHKADICELTCLTEAFFQRYSLDSYHYYTHQMERQQHKQQQRLDSAKELLFGTLRNWVKERKAASSRKFQQEPLPQEQIRDISRVTIASTKRRRKGRANFSRIRRKSKTEAAKQQKNNRNHISPDICHEIGVKSEHTKEGEHIAQDLPSGVEDAKVGVAALAMLSSPTLSSSNNTHTSYSQSTEPCTIDNSSSTLERMPAASFEKAPQTSRGGAIPPLRRCHHCKNTDRVYLRCNFFNATGFKCLKPYCKSCLTSFYDLQDFDGSKRNERDWFCPSCLGYCRCPSCTKDRERQERRSKNTRLRKAV